MTELSVERLAVELPFKPVINRISRYRHFRIARSFSDAPFGRFVLERSGFTYSMASRWISVPYEDVVEVDARRTFALGRRKFLGMITIRTATSKPW